MLRQRLISGLLLGCMILQAFRVTSQVDHDEMTPQLANTIDASANFYVKFLLQHFTAEFGVEGQSEKLETFVRYLSSFGKGYIPRRYLRAGNLHRVMNKMLTEKIPFLYQKPIPDYDTRIVQIGQSDSSRNISYKSLVRWFFDYFEEDTEFIQKFYPFDINEMAKGRKLENLAASAYTKKRRSLFYPIIKIFLDKMSQLSSQTRIYTQVLTKEFQSFLENPEYLKMYFVEEYRIRTQCGLIRATPVNYVAFYFNGMNPRNEFNYLILIKKEYNFGKLVEERGDLFLQPIANLKSRTVPDLALPVWFKDIWLWSQEDTKPGAHAIPVCDMMKYFEKDFEKDLHRSYERDFSEATFLVLMKYWVQSQHNEMKKAQELIDKNVNKLVDPRSPQMTKRMEQCYLRSVFSAWYAQIEDFREQLDQNRASALAAARRYLVKMDLWPRYAGKKTKAFVQWSGKQLGTGQQVMPQAMVKVPKPELWHYIPSKTLSLSQLDAIKNSFDKDLFAEKGNNLIKKTKKWISQLAKPGSSSVQNLKSIKNSNERMYYRVRLAVYLAFFKPCSNAPNSLKQTFKKAPFGGPNLSGSKLSRKKKP